MRTLFVSVSGCDDSTHFAIDIPVGSIPAVRALVKACNETSSNQCMPDMSVGDQPKWWLAADELPHFDDDGVKK